MSRLIRNKETVIRASGLFSDEHYRSQLGNQNSSVNNAIRHYLLRGERMGLSPMPLFDKEWYLQQYPDVAAAVQDLFFHYVEYGEREHRSPHPLFDAVYYQRQASEPIDRPLTHFLSANGRASLNPHPLFNIDRFLKSYGNILQEGENPLLAFLGHEKFEGLLSDIFQGRHYAAEMNEDYSWPKHGIVQFIKQARRQEMAAHPNFDLDAYLRICQDNRWSGPNSFAHFVFTKVNGDIDQISHPTPIRGEKLAKNFEGNYEVRLAPIEAAGLKQPISLTALPKQLVSSSIQARFTNTQRDLNGRLRLDRSASVLKTNTYLPIISILMPVYRPPLVFLDRAIRSVLQQTSGNWELCIIDDCSADDALTELLTTYAASDARIKVGTAHRNGGISRASNAAFSLATGTYVALLDNDDMLTVDAIAAITQALTEDPDLDFIYSDECLIDENDLALRLFSKPDWSPTFLFSCMYTGHFSTYRKALVQEVGGFRPQFDFSQDYDLALRICDKAPRVRHLQAYLYGWRMIAGSAAQGGKPFARLTNVAALQDALERRHYPGEALGFPTTNVLTRNRTTKQPRVSIIIPSDNLENITVTVKSIISHTDYSNLEILVVTNSSIVDEIVQQQIAPFLTCVPYDRPFNFSDKCNVGAEAATGQYLVFYNDDVRVISPNWVHSLLDLAILDHVGSVSPKLLYEDGLIQHAGMVTGVRRLVGTAFHTFPSETSDHFGMAQYAREVSLLCGACIMVKTDVYRKIGGFDARNAPINHSDVDLCFRIRELGLACVYVPTASLKHIGHVSISEVEAKSKSKLFKRDKADIFLLKRWGYEVAYDPYFPPPMRDILYKDSQEPFQVYPGIAVRGGRTADTKRDILLVSHDLTNSGAPKIILDLARALRADGNYVCVMSPTDGPMRSRLTSIGIDVIVDELTLTGNHNVFDFAKNFDLAIANTVVTWPFVTQLGAILPVYWYIHESELVDHYVNVFPEFLASFAHAAAVWVGSGKSGQHLSSHGIADFEIVPYGIEENSVRSSRTSGFVEASATRPLTVGLFGSFEPRKGQDLAVLGLLDLSSDERRNINLRLFGRVLDEAFAKSISEIAGEDPSIYFGGELTPDSYMDELARVDVVIVPSRDDTLPLVSLDALASSKVLVVSRTTGTSEWLKNAHSAFILESNSPAEIAEVFRGLSTDWAEASLVGAAGRACFEQNFSWSSFTTRIRALLTDTQASRLPATRAEGISLIRSAS